VAAEIKKRAGDENTPAWKKVMVMGQDLCSDNLMFQGSMVGGLDVDSLSPKSPEMDFDLGLDAAAGEGEASTDLDLSLDDQPLELPEMDETADVEQDESEVIAQPAGEIEFDLSDTGAVEAMPATEDEFSLDIDASELDIDIQEETEEAIASEEDEIHDVGDIDFGLDEETPAEEVAETDDEIAIDLTDEAESMDFDLGDEPVADEPAAVEEEAPAPVADNLTEEEDFDLSSLDDVDEVSTKLDLARAYLDMGDHEGTRGILEEVIAEGNDEQKQEANDLMEKLD